MLQNEIDVFAMIRLTPAPSGVTLGKELP